jgi:hypothetical protein
VDAVGNAVEAGDTDPDAAAVDAAELPSTTARIAELEAENKRLMCENAALEAGKVRCPLLLISLHTVISLHTMISLPTMPSSRLPCYCIPRLVV